MDVMQPAPSSAALEILVVDDNPATRYSTARVLRAAGFTTREAGTGAEALANADDSIAAVVLDVHLPDMEGYAVCRTLRERTDTSRVPVVYLSAAHVRDNDKLRGVHSGADAYMTHPAEPALLVATLQALIRARTAEDGMRRSEARFRAIYDQAPNGICLIDAAGKVIEANHAMLALLGREESEVVGSTLVELSSPQWSAVIETCLDASKTSVWRGEFPLLDSNGDFVHLEWSVSVHIEQGLRMAIATNISERIELSRERERLLEREQAARAAAERVSRSKDEFIAVLSHELRTPLNAILGWVHVLKRADAATMANLARGLDAIERNAKTQTRLISDILDMSRMGLGKLSLDFQSIDAAELVTSAVSALNPALADKSLKVVIDVATVTRPVIADPARLQQVVWNLLTNAIKFSSLEGHIFLELAQDDTSLRLTVRDEGQGIKPEFLPYLFERFTQSDSASNRYHGGLGLGLSIVKQLVELHGGRISASSEGPGRGANFTAIFPAHVSVAVDTVHVEGQDEIIDVHEKNVMMRPSLKGLSIVIVEDDGEAREMLGIILRDHGATVMQAGNYTEGLRAVELWKPDLLISDIGMPGRDGYDLIRELRRREEGGARMPAIALTAFARQEDRELAFHAGFDAHTAKPLRPNELLASIVDVTSRSTH